MSEAPSAAPNAAQVIARRLAAAGCRHAFGIPGGEVLTLIDALDKAGIAFVLAKHETAAGFMAEGTYQMTGAPGILVATLGPGVANAVNVIANAMQDRVPLIVLTGRVDPAEAATYTHQVFDHGALLGPITKASLTAVDGAVDTIIDKAVAIAGDGQPGPVHVDLPIAVAGAPQPGARAIQRLRPAPAAPAPGAALDGARALLAASTRPLLIAGVDAVTQNAAPTVAAFARDFAMPVITTYKAKGVLPEDDRLSLGGAGLSPKADACLMPLIEAADCIVLAGYDPIEMRVGWRRPWPDDAPVIEFTAAPPTHGMHQARFGFVGDIGAGIAVLRDGAAPRPVWADGAPERVRAALAEAFPASEDWGPAAVVDATRRALPDDAVVAVDTGAHRILLSQIWRCPAPRTLLQSSGLCTMGCALPLAIGAKLAAPGRPVAAVVGDAGLEMVLGELATARDRRLGLPVVVFVDASLALIELKQRRSQLANLGVDFGATDFPAVAEAMGGVGVMAGDRKTLAGETAAALARETFTLIACPIGRHAYDDRF